MTLTRQLQLLWYIYVLEISYGQLGLNQNVSYSPAMVLIGQRIDGVFLGDRRMEKKKKKEETVGLVSLSYSSVMTLIKLIYGGFRRARCRSWVCNEAWNILSWHQHGYSFRIHRHLHKHSNNYYQHQKKTETVSSRVRIKKKS